LANSKKIGHPTPVVNIIATLDLSLTQEEHDFHRLEENNLSKRMSISSYQVYSCEYVPDINQFSVIPCCLLLRAAT
jgi:hypothetical protein